MIHDPDTNGLSVSGWGASLKAAGRDVVLIVVVISGFAGLGVILYRGFIQVEMFRSAQTAEHRLVEARIDRLQRSQDDLTCMLALPTELRLDSLRDSEGVCHYARLITRFETPSARGSR